MSHSLVLSAHGSVEGDKMEELKVGSIERAPCGEAKGCVPLRTWIESKIEDDADAPDVEYPCNTCRKVNPGLCPNCGEPGLVYGYEQTFLLERKIDVDGFLGDERISPPDWADGNSYGDMVAQIWCTECGKQFGGDSFGRDDDDRIILEADDA